MVDGLMALGFSLSLLPQHRLRNRVNSIQGLTRYQNLRETARVKRRQLPLFSPRTALPSPFARWSRKFDEIRICARCGREIATRRTRQDEVVGEFVSESGACWSCEQPSC